jgi:hypothetical protein
LKLSELRRLLGPPPPDPQEEDEPDGSSARDWPATIEWRKSKEAEWSGEFLGQFFSGEEQDLGPSPLESDDFDHDRVRTKAEKAWGFWSSHKTKVLLGEYMSKIFPKYIVEVLKQQSSSMYGFSAVVFIHKGREKVRLEFYKDFHET